MARPIRDSMPEAWHALDADTAFARLGSSPKGLSKEEAEARLSKAGPNELVQTERVSPIRIFLEQFTDVLVAILILAALVSGYLGLSRGESTEVWDALLIALIVLLNAGLGFLQEFRAERSLQALKALAAPRARVVREAETLLVPSRDLVPGDVVLLAAGDQVPADLRLSEAASLRTNEASLTGESTPVGKSTAPLPADAFLGDRKNLAFLGTTVEGGRGRGLVVATGMETELGKIAGLVQKEAKEETPLQRQLDRLGRQIGLLVLGIAGVVFVLMFLKEVDPLSNVELLFLTAVGLAVAAIPEGLPAVVTISLALGLQRMIRRHALIRKLPAVEALGAATVICSDKTGTLTKGEMNVREVYAGGHVYEIHGEGFDPSGEIVSEGRPVALHDVGDLREALVCGALCNDASIRREGGRWRCDGDPTEGALVVAAMRAGLDADVLRSEQPRVAEIAFTSERKRMSTLHAPASAQALRELLVVSEDRRHLSLAEIGAKMLYAKGAPERILEACRDHLVAGRRTPLTDYDRKQYAFQNQQMATHALRVLGLASRSFPGEVPPIREGGLETGLTFLGLVGMMDAPRQDAVAAVDRCKKAGIEVVMITGDHKLTAMAVAREMGILASGERALTGEELDRIPEDDLVRDVERIKVYARVSPEHKTRIVEAWKTRGHVVAMTGDGVNDAPALKRADLGVAMGITGTDVAKESADMVLTDDNFASIVAAVEEGRGIYENIRKFVAYLLSANAGEVSVMLLATLFIVDPAFLPFFTPVQLLWINLVTDGLPALALGVDPYPRDIMGRRPRDPKEGVLSRGIGFQIVIIAGILTAGTLGIFAWEVLDGSDPVRTQTVAFTTIVFFELFLVFAMRSPRQTVWQLGLLTNRKLIYAVLLSMALQILVIYAPPLQAAFHTEPLTAMDWVRTVLISFSAFLAVEVLKLVRQLRTKAPSPTEASPA